jgi:MoxR-like ATPase
MEAQVAVSESNVNDVEKVKLLHEKRDAMLAEIAKVIIGQDKIIREMLIALFSGGHCLLVGVPGLAKTSLVRTFARILHLKFQRIQFTPDLLPSDITGTDILEENKATGERFFRFVKGPIFANILLADEINRTPPKTQAALLEAMQEYRVTAGGQDYCLDLPFFVLATQNPIEQEGTYPLPEAQLDRFMFHILVDYPERDNEVDIVKSTTSAYIGSPEPVLSGPEIIEMQNLVRRVPVSDEMVQYAVDLVKATRPRREDSTGSPELKEYVARYVSWGAGPRASQYLILAGKARAILEGRYSVGREDIRAVAHPVLRHRVLVNFRAEADGLSTDDVISRILGEIQ